MAIDTADKRSSAVNVASPWRGLLPLPDGAALDQGDRQHVGLHYRGIEAGGGGAGATALRLRTLVGVGL